MAITPRSLEAPLPTGMRDRLPPEAHARRSLIDRILRRAGLWGYALVEPPSFEFAAVLERGLPGGDASDVLRFVDPESGEVAALRPDVTPQVARILATRMGHAPLPVRLMYNANVVRRVGRSSAARREVSQCGVELAGPCGPLGDLELLVLADEVLAAEGLSGVTLDLGDAQILEELLACIPPAHRAELHAALDRRDRRAIEDMSARLPKGTGLALAKLLSLDDDPASIDRARAILGAWPSALRALDRLAALVDLARGAALAARIRVDVTTLRGLAYYTSTTFQYFAYGSDDAIVSGGRYDSLLARYGRNVPSSGLAIDLDRLLRLSTVKLPPSPVRVAVRGARAMDAARTLRAAGLVAVLEVDASSCDAAYVVDDRGFVVAATGVHIVSEKPETSLLEYIKAAASSGPAR